MNHLNLNLYCKPTMHLKINKSLVVWPRYKKIIGSLFVKPGNTMYKVTVLLLAATLTACSADKPQTLSKIDALQIPVVAQSPYPAEPNALAAQYQNNERIIENVTDALKTQYLQNVSSRDIFDVHSEAHQVYAALSKLDQLQLINRYYLKAQNLDGLNHVGSSLQPLEKG